MKKFVFVLAVAALASCNNAADAEKRAKDSLDSVANAVKESVNDAAKDAKNNIDSTTEVKKDSVDSMHSGTDTSAHK